MLCLICAMAPSISLTWAVIWSAASPSSAGGGALKAETGGEQPLDHMVVKVSRDPAAIFEQRDSSSRALRLFAVHRDADVAGEGHAQVEVLG